MKKTFLSLMTLATVVCSAQQVTVTSSTSLLRGVEKSFYPTLNSEGNKLLFSDADAHGLKMLDLTSGAVTVISNDDGAGTFAKWSNDKIYYVTAQVNPTSHLVYRTGMSYDIATGAGEVVLEAQHGAVLPRVGTKGLAIKGEKRTFSSKKNLGTSVYTTGSQVIVNINGTEHSYSPVESYAGYLWASLSPKADKVAFFAAGHGIVVMDLQGKVLAHLGNYEMPVWYDNDYIVAQNATDDGYQFTSSQILLLKADGSFKHQLTAPTSMTMQPTCGGGKIVYTTIDGNLTMITLDIKE